LVRNRAALAHGTWPLLSTKEEVGTPVAPTLPAPHPARSRTPVPEREGAMPNAVLDVLARALCALVSCASPARPIVTEVYYDAPGDDTGWEFVELWNPSDHDVALAGLVLEAGDGAGAGRWTVRWTGAARDTIRARARFVVGGAHLAPPPDATVTLELQNGPDGLRLTWPDGGREVVGWGALAWPEYFCGAPAADVPAGQSLARVPDGADLGSNALDFRAADPSPGRANQPGVDLALPRGALALAPESPAPGEALRLHARVLNRGATALAAGAAVLVCTGDALADSVRASVPASAPGETLDVALPSTAGAAGRRSLEARVVAPGDGAALNDADTLAVRVGPGPLELTEIQFHPGAAEGEWVEVRNRSGAPLSLAGFTLSDRGDGRVRILTESELPDDSLAVLAQDRAALLAAFPGLDSARVVTVAPWPSLNNSDAADGFADFVVLREADGLPVDRVGYSAAGVPAGTPLEKDAGAWASSSAPNGTPLQPPRHVPPGPVRFAASPRRVALAAPELELSWQLPWPVADVTVELYDLAGRFVARLMDAQPSTALGTRRVRLDGAGAGVYALVLRARTARETFTRAVPVRVVGVTP
jgi:hypothetical protein